MAERKKKKDPLIGGSSGLSHLITAVSVAGLAFTTAYCYFTAKEEKKKKESIVTPVAPSITIEEVDKTTCNICFEYEKNVVLNCGHTVCAQCSHQLQQCPMCRVDITERKKLYL